MADDPAANDLSLQRALAFFAAVRQRPDLQDRIAAGGPGITAGDLAELASHVGFPCAATDVQAAFRHDWMMRWLHQAGRSSTP